jgi:hypothetical protein
MGPGSHDYSFSSIISGGHIGSHNDTRRSASGNRYVIRNSTLRFPGGHVDSNNKGELGEIIVDGATLVSSTGNFISGISHPYRFRI